MFLIDLQIFNCIIGFLGITATSIQKSVSEEKAFSHVYTVKNENDFPVPSRDVTNQTLPGGE
jgi:hypothetical protein